MKSLLAMLIVAAALFVGACNNSTGGVGRADGQSSGRIAGDQPGDEPEASPSAS